MRKQKFFAITNSATSSIWTTFRYERVKSKHQNYCQFVLNPNITIKIGTFTNNT